MSSDDRALTINSYHLPYDQYLVEKAKQLRQNMTPSEQQMWRGYLKIFPKRVLRQRPIEHFIVDFYCAELKLVIEVDGDVHFTIQAREYDQEITGILEKSGLKVIRFTNDEVLNNFNAVCESIDSFMGG